jgi:hypothetical protein
MQKKIFLTTLIVMFFCTTSFSQKVLFSENFDTPLKWKVSSRANGSMTFEKEGSENIMKVEAYDGKEFQTTIKVPAIQPTTKKISIQYDFYLNDVYNSQVLFGESPNRLWVISEKNKSLRLAGESIQMADGAKFLNATPNIWHKIMISYDLESKLATFTLDGKDSKVVDLNQQPDKTYQFSPTSIAVKSLKAGVIKIKAIVISES